MLIFSSPLLVARVLSSFTAKLRFLIQHQHYLFLNSERSKRHKLVHLQECCEKMYCEDFVLNVGDVFIEADAVTSSEFDIQLGF